MSINLKIQQQRIAESRRALGLSQHDVARQGGIPQAALSRIEAGKKAASSPELAAISYATGATIGFLTGEGSVFDAPKFVARAREGADVASATAQLLHLMDMDAELDDNTGAAA